MLLPLLWLLWCAEEALLAARDGLVGQIQQLPPMYSAIKVGIMPG
jgi:tRNA U55 pseudouridine synthase TruB